MGARTIVKALLALGLSVTFVAPAVAGEEDRPPLKKYVSETFGIRFQYPAKFVAGRYKPPELSEEVKASMQAAGIDAPFKNAIVLVEPKELGKNDKNSIPVGEVATISLDLKKGSYAQFIKQQFCKEEFEQKLGRHTVYRLPGYPGPYGENAFYYLIPIDTGIFDVTALKHYLRDFEKYLSEGKELPPTHYDKEIESIIKSMEFLKRTKSLQQESVPEKE